MGRGKGSFCKTIFAIVFAAAIVAVIVAVCAVYMPRIDDDHHESKVKVHNTAAFDNGGGSHKPTKDQYGGVEGKDEFKLYTGQASAFPKKEDWIAFDDMWESNQKLVVSACSDHGWGDNNSDEENERIKKEIQSVARASLVDHRFILAIILQESKGCLRVKSTTSAKYDISTPGLMQSHNGSDYDPEHSKSSIRQMIQDGTQGTPHGDGLVQTLNKFGNAYAAARGYNSGALAKSGDLSDALGATTCYASDVTNRLTGWVKAPTKCSDDLTSSNTETAGSGEEASAAPVSTPEQSTTAQQAGSGLQSTDDGSYQPDSNGWRSRRRRTSRKL